MKPVTQQAHELIKSKWPETSSLHSNGDQAARRQPLALDATAGNGHDTLFLAELVGEAGRVWAFDLQAQAINRTCQRLAENGITSAIHHTPWTPEHDGRFPPRVTLIQADHARMMGYLPVADRGRVSVIMFNLGYLPGGDKSIITEVTTTLAALDAAMQLLGPAGLLSVVVYPGHPRGEVEALSVEAWFRKQHVEQHGSLVLPVEISTGGGPQLLLLQRR